MAPKYKYELEDKVWIVAQQMPGVIVDIVKNKYDVEYQYSEEWYDMDGDLTVTLTNNGRGLYMAHELLPYTEGMELLYDI